MFQSFENAANPADCLAAIARIVRSQADFTAGLVAAMEALRTDRDRRDSLGQLGFRGWQDLWSEDAHIRAYVELIKEAAAGNVHGSHSLSSTRSPVSADR